jgi:CDP-6-deoxy-D-xylo-4-hexulose-3-dehydrase
MQADSLRDRIFALVREHYADELAPREFVPGVSPVPVSGKVFDADELVHLVDASLDFWLTSGRYAARFEHEIAEWFGLKHALLVNSGSSANLVAFSTLTSPKLRERRLRPGDEVITVAAGFPTTVNPIVQQGCVPVFVDVEVPTYNVVVDQLDEALSERTRAVVLAHTLGNPFRVDVVRAFCERHGLWLIEDCCDALGSTFDGRHVGTFGDLATLSFYPAHHITMGEGGAVLTNDGTLRFVAESFRDWGRDCWCAPGCDNTCKKRFAWTLGDLPPGYDHKYTYSHLGFNLKVTDMQAAVGVAQLQKARAFVAARRANFARLLDEVRKLEEFLVAPQATPGSDPSWFGFPIAVREEAPFTRDDLTRSLESARIGTRLLFAGNLVRQPAYRDVRYRVVGDLAGADFAMRNVFWVGVHPGLTPPMLDYMIERLHHSVKEMAYVSGAA